MKQFVYTFSFLAIILQSCSTPTSQNDVDAIKELMNKQVEAWNSGDIPGYMKGYWNNDSLLFIGKSGPNYGYTNTQERYQKAYSDKEKMGQLDFSSLQYKKLSDEYYFVTGAWRLTRKEDTPAGYFTLLFRKIDDEWVIVADHSS